MKGKFSIGIDPGKSGAVAIIYPAGSIETWAIPLSAKEVDLYEFAKRMKKFSTYAKTLKNVHCVLEDVHSIFGTGAKANFEFGRVLGMCEAILTSLEIPFTKVAPKTWQKECWQGVKVLGNYTGKKLKNGTTQFKVDNKGTSLTAVKRLCPGVCLLATENSKKPHDGIVDAILLAEYCKRKL